MKRRLVAIASTTFQVATYFLVIESPAFGKNVSSKPSANIEILNSKCDAKTWRFTYRLTNKTNTPLFALVAFAYDFDKKRFSFPAGSTAVLKTPDKKSLVIAKKWEPIPDGLSYEIYPTLGVARVDPGKSFSESLELPIQLQPWSLHQMEPGKKKPTTIKINERLVVFQIGLIEVKPAHAKLAKVKLGKSEIYLIEDDHAADQVVIRTASFRACQT